jgi:hypothetical protein
MFLKLHSFDYGNPILVNIPNIVKIESFEGRAAQKEGAKAAHTGARITTVNNIHGRTEEASKPTDVRETLEQIEDLLHTAVIIGGGVIEVANE